MLDRVQNVPAFANLQKNDASVMSVFRASALNMLETFPVSVLHEPAISRPYGAKFHYVMHPPTVKHILYDAVEDYPKSNLMVDISHTVAKNTIIADHGDSWKKARKGILPSFRPANLRTYADVFTGAAERAAARLDKQAGSVVELGAEMTETAYQVISDVVASGSRALDSVTTKRALSAFQNETARVSLLDMIDAPLWIPRARHLGIPPVITYWKKQVDQVIRDRKATGAARQTDMLQDMLDAQGADTAGFWTDARIRDNVTTMMIAGHETTSNTMAWALYLCAFDPKIQKAAQGQVANVLNRRVATIDDLPKLPLIQQILDETMRLYPALCLLTRQALKTETIHGTHIQAGDTVIVPLYALHRNKLLWEKPDEFDPARFKNGGNFDKYQYIPFGAGKRICIGAQFAMFEAPIVLATLLGRFRFSLVPGRTPRPMLKVTMASSNGFNLQVDRI